MNLSLSSSALLLSRTSTLILASGLNQVSDLASLTRPNCSTGGPQAAVMAATPAALVLKRSDST